MNKNQKGIVDLLLVAAVLIVGVVTLLYFSWQKGLIKTAPSVKISPTPTTSADETANWNTYKNNVYGYTLKYPPDWNVTGGPVALGSQPEVSSESDHPIFSNTCNYDKRQLCSQISLEVGGNTTQNPDEFFEKQITYGDKENKITNKIKTIVGGRDAILFNWFVAMEGSGNVNAFGYGILHRALILNYKNTQYLFIYTEAQKEHKMKDPSDWQNIQVFDQILSTFKFTN